MAVRIVLFLAGTRLGDWIYRFGLEIRRESMRDVFEALDCLEDAGLKPRATDAEAKSMRG